MSSAVYQCYLRASFVIAVVIQHLWLHWYFYGYKIQINCKPLRVRWLIQACPSVFVRGLARQNDSRVPMKYWVFTWLRFHLHMRVHDLSRNTPKKANQITAAFATPPPRQHRPVSYTRLNYSAIKKPSLASIRPPRSGPGPGPCSKSQGKTSF